MTFFQYNNNRPFLQYNNKRYLELLKRSEYFKNIGKRLYVESSDEYLELIRYQATIQDYVYWKNRTIFLLLMKKFVNRIISGEEFSNKFDGLRQKYIDETEDFLKKLGSEKFKDFQVDPRSYGFGNLITFIYLESDNFIDDYQNKEFYDSIKACFLELQKVLNEE